MAISISFACNNPDNGNFTGRFDKLEVDAGNLHLEFESADYPSRGIPVSFEFPVTNGYGKVKVGRLEVQGLSYKNWYGNWCWDMARFTWCDALAIINYLGRSKVWRMVDGDTDLFEAFNERREITPLEWKANNEARRTA
jgi:hypothetical protein